MINIYHADLSLPVVFDPQYSESDIGNRSYKIDPDDTIVLWLDSIGLEVVRGGAELFYTAPYKSMPIHADGTTQDNKVKLNFQFGGTGSEMRWYQRITNANESIVPGQFGRYVSITDDNVTQVWSANIGKPSLINAGVLHRVVNSFEPRWVISIPLWDISANQNLQWEDALIKFAPWLL